MKCLSVFVIVFITCCELFASNESVINAYGKQVYVHGVLNSVSSDSLAIDPHHGYPNKILVLTLDQPIDSLPMPLIPGEDENTSGSINKMIALFATEEIPSSIIGTHQKFLGSIWYADWLSLKLPFLLIVDEIAQLP